MKRFIKTWEKERVISFAFSFSATYLMFNAYLLAH